MGEVGSSAAIPGDAVAGNKEMNSPAFDKLSWLTYLAWFVTGCNSISSGCKLCRALLTIVVSAPRFVENAAFRITVIDNRLPEDCARCNPQ